MDASGDLSKSPQTTTAKSSKWKQVGLLKFVTWNKKRTYIQIEHDEDAETAAPVSVAVKKKSNWKSGQWRSQDAADSKHE